MGVEVLQRAVAASGPVIDAVRPEQYGLSTPCASWTVADLIEHIAGAQLMFAAGLGVDAESGADDLTLKFHQAAAASLAAFGADGALDQLVAFGPGQVPGAVAINFAAGDMFVHAWDVARATGQSTDLDPELADQLLAIMGQALQPAFRGPEGAAFGPEQNAPDGATAADRLAAFTGRRV